MTVTGMLIYSVLIILHYYFIIIFYYDNIILSYYYIILHNIAFIDTFSIMAFALEWLHINDFELSRTVLGTEFRRASFPCWNKHTVFTCVLFFWAQAPGARTHGPRPMGPPFSDFLEICKIVRDLCKSVPMVFRSPGKRLITLFHFIFN